MLAINSFRPINKGSRDPAVPRSCLHFPSYFLITHIVSCAVFFCIFSYQTVEAECSEFMELLALLWSLGRTLFVCVGHYITARLSTRTCQFNAHTSTHTHSMAKPLNYSDRISNPATGWYKSQILFSSSFDTKYVFACTVRVFLCVWERVLWPLFIHFTESSKPLFPLQQRPAAHHILKLHAFTMGAAQSSRV